MAYLRDESSLLIYDRYANLKSKQGNQSFWTKLVLAGRIIVGAVIAFGVISVFVGISWDISTFIFFRLLQGFSAGIISRLMSTLLVKAAGHATFNNYEAPDFASKHL